MASRAWRAWCRQPLSKILDPQFAARPNLFIAPSATVLEAADRKAGREEEEARALAAMGGSVDEGCEEGDICIADQPILRVAEHIPSQNEAPACVLPPKSR